jgi:hypothetical protein
VYPIGHLALAYLCYAAYTEVTESRLPRGLPLVVLAVASQLPDLVDKPLAYVGVLASGRSLAHSLLVVVPLLLAARWVLGRTARPRTAPAFVVGVLAHLLGDTYSLALAGAWSEMRFLLWPVFPAIDYPGDDVAPWVRILTRDLTAYAGFEYLLAGVALVVWFAGRYRRTATE